jgi:hypothetical protein
MDEPPNDKSNFYKWRQARRLSYTASRRQSVAFNGIVPAKTSYQFAMGLVGDFPVFY